MKSCLLLPGASAEDLLALERLADLAVTKGAADPALPYFQTSRGLAYYRKGNYAEAERWLLRALDDPLIGQQEDWTMYMAAQAGPVLVMTWFRLGRVDEARGILEEVEALPVTDWNGTSSATGMIGSRSTSCCRKPGN